MKVLAFDPFVPPRVFTRAGVERVEFRNLLAAPTIVSVHTPLLPETRGLFSRTRSRR
jgi:phosphoglycerate dehydrogenase-like enzyme